MHHVIRKILIGVGIGIAFLLLAGFATYLDYRYNHEFLPWLAKMLNW